jgi:hypothetical protein
MLRPPQTGQQSSAKITASQASGSPVTGMGHASRGSGTHTHTPRCAATGSHKVVRPRIGHPSSLIALGFCQPVSNRPVVQALYNEPRSMSRGQSVLKAVADELADGRVIVALAEGGSVGDAAASVVMHCGLHIATQLD